MVCAGAEDFWVVDESLERRVPPEVEVVRVPAGGSLVSALIGRRAGAGRRSGRGLDTLRRIGDWSLAPDSYAGWSRRASRVAARLIEERAGGTTRFDAVLSTSPPDSVHLGALALKRRFALPWVADFRDPWMALAFRKPPTRWHRERQQRLERSVLDGADLVLAASATHAEAMSAAVPNGSRVLHLPNGFESEEDGSAAAVSGGAAARDPGAATTNPSTAATTDPVAGAASGDAHDGVFRMVYSGILSLMPDVAVFLDALHDLLATHPEARRRVRVALVGAYDSDYADRVIALGLSGIVEFLGPRPHHESRARQRGANLLLLWKPRAMPTMVPGKLYEYLDAARPLVAVVDPSEEVARLVTRAGGVVVAPGDRGALTQELARHYRAWRDGAPIRASRPAWLDEHTRARLTGRLAERLEGLIGSGR